MNRQERKKSVGKLANIFYYYKMQRLFWVDIHYACFGIVSRNDIIEDAPPIADWMIGKSLVTVKPWLLKCKARVLEIK
jgi:hypothetical protein